MNVVEMFEKMCSGEVKAHSELGTRDEAKQVKNFGTRIQKMKTVTGINARVMPMKDIVIPFNPFTGEADDVYNKTTPYRPILLVSQAIEGIKKMCESNPAMKAFWEKELGISFVPGKATMDEYLAFKAKDYIKPRVMSYSTVAINFGGRLGFPDFRCKYTVDPTQLNESGSYDFDNAPVWHQAAIFFNSMLKPEADDRKSKLEAAGQSKETIASERRAVFSKAPVGFVNPTNLIPFLMFNLNEPLPEFDVEKPTELEKYIRFYGFTDKWTMALKDAMKEPMFDGNMDFFDFTVKTPTSSDRKKDNTVYTDEDANELYAAMTINNTDGRMALESGSTNVDGKMVPNTELYKNVYATAAAYFAYSQEQSFTDGGETFEKIMASSNRFRPITSILDNFLPACNDVFVSTFANTAYFTENIKKANHAFFVSMNPENAMALAGEDEEDLAAAKEKERASVQELIEESQNSANALVTDDADILNVDISELNMDE